jgi:hypothetical protein
MQQMLRIFPDMHVYNDPHPIQFGSGDWIAVSESRPNHSAPIFRFKQISQDKLKFPDALLGYWSPSFLVEELQFLHLFELWIDIGSLSPGPVRVENQTFL